MKKINFNDPATFEKLEHMAYENTLDYTDFPPAEYKYFDKLSQLGSIYRSGQLPKGLCKERKDAYLCEINSTRNHDVKLMLALRCIELMTGEEGFERRNLNE